MKKQYVIQEVIECYENDSAEGGYDRTEYRDIEFIGLFNPMGPYSTIEETEKGIKDLLDRRPNGKYRIDMRYVS